jgi:hypothetical protein
VKPVKLEGVKLVCELHSDLLLPMAPGLAYERLPRDRSGVYAWITATEALDSAVPDNLGPVPIGTVVYVGKANVLRKRAPHHRWTSSSSSLRRNLAGVLELQGQRLPRASNPRLIPEHESFLSNWMGQNLVLSWCVVETDWKVLEQQVIAELQPALNVDPPETELQWWVHGRLQHLREAALPPVEDSKK